jgi:hypothetical protein
VVLIFASFRYLGKEGQQSQQRVFRLEVLDIVVSEKDPFATLMHIKYMLGAFHFR